MQNIYLLTGSTGFLGSLLSIELLKEGNSLIFLGRSKKGIPLKDRILSKISSIDSDFHPDESHIRVIEADVSTMEDAVNNIAATIGKIDGIWHLAANLSFKESERDAVFNVNVNGTKNIARLAEILQAPLYYTSTAYVHGKRTGIIYEDELVPPPAFNNAYEESKFKAEEFLKEWSKRTSADLIIFRPSILIETHNISFTSFGYYTVVVALARLKTKLAPFLQKHVIFSKLINARLNKNILYLSIPFPNSTHCTLDLVPIEWVIEWMITIVSDKKAKGKTFHLTNPQPFPFREVISETFEGIGIDMPVFTLPPFLIYFYFSCLRFIGFFFTPLKPFSQKIFPYRFYMIESVVHNMRNTKEMVGDLSRYSMGPGSLSSIARAFAERWTKKLS